MPVQTCLYTGLTGGVCTQGSAWHAAAELHKLELILNVLTLGYSVLYMEPDATVFRNPMLHLLSLQVCSSPQTLPEEPVPDKHMPNIHVLDRASFQSLPRRGKP